jgi:hypothetical protein
MKTYTQKQKKLTAGKRAPKAKKIASVIEYVIDKGTAKEPEFE